MKSPELRQRLLSGDPLFGTLIVSTSPRWPEAVSGSGLDFVFIDTEHIAIDRAELSWMCQAYAALGFPPLVRIPSPDPYTATMVLDGGATGVIAPYIETVEQVQALRGAVKMRPIKGRKLQQLLDGKAAGPALEALLRQGAEQRLLIINIESRQAIENLDTLVQVSGLDGVLIGPHDLSCNLGIPEQYDNPDFLAACETIFRKARAAGIGAGIHFWGDVEQQARMLKLGANLLIHSGDILLFKKHLVAELDAVREAAGITWTDNRTGAGINI
jgi:4-hydroxy-2-oxoheptanedioate aldolase